MKHSSEFVTFSADLLAKLQLGEQTYGTAGFDRPNERLIEEVQEELIDVCGWSFILWCKLQALKPQVAVLALPAVEQNGHVRLTARQTELVRLVAGGLTNKQIAERLKVAERTAKTHITDVLNRLRIKEGNFRVQLTRWAYTHGVI